MKAVDKKHFSPEEVLYVAKVFMHRRSCSATWDDYDFFKRLVTDCGNEWVADYDAFISALTEVLKL